NGPKLDKTQADLPHKFVAKSLFVAKRGRPDIKVLVAFLCTRVQEPREEDYLEDLFHRWAALDYRRAASSLVKLIERCDQGDAYSGLLGKLISVPISAWMIDDPEGTKKWVRQLPRTSYAEAYAFEAVLAEIAKHNHQGAWEWLTQRAFNSERAFEHLVVQVIEDLGVRNSLQWFGSLPVDPAFKDLRTGRAGLSAAQAADRSRAEVWKCAINHLFQRDRDAVADWVMMLPASVAEEQALKEFVGIWATDEPQQVVEWALSLEDSDHLPAIEAIADHEPGNSVKWSLELVDEELRWAALGKAFPVWIDDLVSHPDKGGLGEAAKWLGALEEEPKAATLFEVMGQSLSPSEAIRWASDLSPGVNRDIALNQGYFGIGRDDPRAGLKLLEGLPSDEGYYASEKISLGALVAQHRELLLEWRSQLPRESPLFYGSMKAEIQLVATFSPEQAGRMITSLPANRQRDFLMIVLIERTAGRSAGQAMIWADEIHQQELRSALHGYIDEAQHQANTLTPLPEIEGKVPFGKQSLNQLMQRLDYVSHRRSPFQYEEANLD
ncbi:MAG: hypothetical protein AAF514_08785, partial [Verrucomicrobiota bacterium]